MFELELNLKLVDDDEKDKRHNRTGQTTNQPANKWTINDTPIWKKENLKQNSHQREKRKRKEKYISLMHSFVALVLHCAEIVVVVSVQYKTTQSNTTQRVSVHLSICPSVRLTIFRPKTKPRKKHCYLYTYLEFIRLTSFSHALSLSMQIPVQPVVVLNEFNS